MKVTAFEVFVAIRLRFSADVISLFFVCEAKREAPSRV